MSFSLIVNSNDAIFDTLTNTNSLSYHFDFNNKPHHPHNTNKYKIFMSIAFNNFKVILEGLDSQSFYVGLNGLGTIKSYMATDIANAYLSLPNNQIIGLITAEADGQGQGNNSGYIQQFKNYNPQMPFIIEDLRTDGIFSVDLYNQIDNKAMPKLIMYYNFENEDLRQGDLLKNQATGQFDLLIEPGVLIDGTLDIPVELNTSASSKINSITLGDNFSIGCWFYIENVPSFSFIYFASSSTTSQNNIIQIYYNTTGVYTISIRNNNNLITVNISNAIQLNAWNNFNWVVDGTTWNFLLNGVFYTFPDKVNVLLKQQVRNYIGGRDIQPNWNVIGNVDNFFIYNDVLTTAQMESIYDNGNGRIKKEYNSTMTLHFEPI